MTTFVDIPEIWVDFCIRVMRGLMVFTGEQNMTTILMVHKMVLICTMCDGTGFEASGTRSTGGFKGKHLTPFGRPKGPFSGSFSSAPMRIFLSILTFIQLDCWGAPVDPHHIPPFLTGSFDFLRIKGVDTLSHGTNFQFHPFANIATCVTNSISFQRALANCLSLVKGGARAMTPGPWERRIWDMLSCISRVKDAVQSILILTVVSCLACGGRLRPSHDRRDHETFQIPLNMESQFFWSRHMCTSDLGHQWSFTAILSVVDTSPASVQNVQHCDCHNSFRLLLRWEYVTNEK